MHRHLLFVVVGFVAAVAFPGCNGGGCGNGYSYPFYVATDMKTTGPESYGFQGDSINYAFADYELRVSATLEGVEGAIGSNQPAPYSVLAAGTTYDDCAEPAIYGYGGKPLNYLTSVTITSDQAWNDTLPAGANLSHFFFVEEAYSYYGTQQNPIDYPGYEVNRYLDPLCQEGFYIPSSFTMRPTQAPAPGYATHRFTITLRTEAGREFTSSPLRVRFLY